MKKMTSIIFVLVSFLIWVGCTHFSSSGSSTQEPRHHADRRVSSLEQNLPWMYDPGPSPDTAMGKELINIVSQQPFMPGISQEMTGEQKFRPAFGPTLWRMISEPNRIKILFIGQDGTHIAEAAGRTATAGFGGRAQDMAAYFGVSTSAAFINTFAFTIRGQYGTFQTPIISEENGVKNVQLGSVVDNGMWMMAQDQKSPMVKWRNQLIDWVIRNNKDSLKMIVLFGGSAKDSIGTFIESRGGHVGTFYTAEDLKTKNIKIPEFSVVSAGANNTFPAVLDKKGKDIYPQITKKRLDYKNEKDQRLATESLKKKISEVYDQLAITNGGIEKSGIVHPAQIKGYMLSKIEINRQKTLSIKGLKLSDGSVIQNDVLIAEFPHPTALSKSEQEVPGSASIKIREALKNILPYRSQGWKIEPDSEMENKFDLGQDYTYGRTDIPRAYYDFGTPNNRMVSKSDASRMTGKSNIVILGTRDKAQFDPQQIIRATEAKPNSPIATEEMFTARPRLQSSRFIFDRGPGLEMAKIMKENLDLTKIGALKAGYKLKPGVRNEHNEDQPIAELADVDGFNIKTHPLAVGDFGHYRGTFKQPKVVILADPDGVDEILTSRAMTGTRGQYLQGLMNQLGASENHLVLRTVPFGMDKATATEWDIVLTQTNMYREKIFEAILKNGTPDLIIADGPYAIKEVARIIQSKIPVVNIQRVGTENSSGLSEAALAVNQLKIFNPVSTEPRMANIPRSHLGFMARVWEGTSGTRVLNTLTPAANGIAFAVIVPSWAYGQKMVQQSSDERFSIDQLKSTLRQNQIPMFIERAQKNALEDEASL